MAHDRKHESVVADWIHTVQNRPPAEQVELFCQVFNAVWRRAKRTLGEVSLLAIGERVFYVSGERHPDMVDVAPQSEGIDPAQLPVKAAETPPLELEAAMAFALTEFLTVVGRLTGEILSPALHTELVTRTAENHTSKPNRAQNRPGEEEKS